MARSGDQAPVSCSACTRHNLCTYCFTTGRGGPILRAMAREPEDPDEAAVPAAQRRDDGPREAQRRATVGWHPDGAGPSALDAYAAHQQRRGPAHAGPTMQPETKPHAPAGQPAKKITDTPHDPAAPTQKRPEPTAPNKATETTIPDDNDLPGRASERRGDQR